MKTIASSLEDSGTVVMTAISEPVIVGVDAPVWIISATLKKVNEGFLEIPPIRHNSTQVLG